MKENIAMIIPFIGFASEKTDAEGMRFTDWDHGAGMDIDEPVWDTLLTFLQKMEEIAGEYEEEWDDEFEDED